MARRSRASRGEEVRDKAALLNAMGYCRDAILAAENSVAPFGVTFKACEVVRRAIDGLVEYLTGEPGFYAANGSSPMPGRVKWEGRAGRPPKREWPSEDDGVAEEG